MATGAGIISPYTRLASSENHSYALVEASTSANESRSGLPFEKYINIKINYFLINILFTFS